MTNARGLELARELTMEYIRQNNLLKCDKEDIPIQIKNIVNVENIIVNCIEKNFHDFKTL